LLLSQFAGSTPHYHPLFPKSLDLYAETGPVLRGDRRPVGAGDEPASGERRVKLILIDSGSLDGIDSPRDRASNFSRRQRCLGHSPQQSRRQKPRACAYSPAAAPMPRWKTTSVTFADLAVERLHGSFALVARSHAGPLLGVLGLCWASPRPHSSEIHRSGGLDSGVLAGFGAALDRGPGPVLVFALMFGAFLVNAARARCLAKVEQFWYQSIGSFVSTCRRHRPGVSLGTAEAQAAEKLIERTEELIMVQTGLWQSPGKSARPLGRDNPKHSRRSSRSLDRE